MQGSESVEYSTTSICPTPGSKEIEMGEDSLSRQVKTNQLGS